MGIEQFGKILENNFHEERTEKIFSDSLRTEGMDLPLINFDFEMDNRFVRDSKRPKDD